MCMEDICIGRKSHVAQHRISMAGGASVEVLKANPDRISFVVAEEGGNDFFLTLDSTLSNGQGLHCSANASPHTFDVSTYGQLVTSSILSNNGGVQTLVIIETILEKECK